MQTITELKKSKFAPFAHITDTFTRLRQIDAVGYIENLAAASQTQVSDWPVTEIFKTEAGLIETNRSLINRRFFEYRDSKVRISPKISPDLVKALASHNSYISDQERRNIERNLNNAMNSALTHEHERDRYVIKARQYDNDLRMFSGTKVDLAEQLSPLIESGDWELRAVTPDGTLDLLLVDDILLSYKNSMQGININQLNLGKFRATYNIRDGRLRVLPNGKNLYVSSYCHPHLNSGSLCLGLEAENLVNARAKGKINEVLKIIASVLRHYNHASPYMSLTNFAALAKGERDPNGYTTRIDTDSIYYREENEESSADILDELFGEDEDESVLNSDE